MPKIAHVGDIHLRHDNRFEDTLRCLDFAIEDGIAQRVDLWVIPGDLFDTKSTPVDRNALALRLCRMADHAPVVIGRGNHDKIGDLTIFELLDAAHPIRVFEQPGIITLGGVEVFVLPHFDKSQAAGLLPADLPIEQADDAMVQAVKTIFLHWRGELTSSATALEGEAVSGAPSLFSKAHIATYPAVMIGHLTIAGSILSNGEPHPHQGIQLSIADLDQLGFDAVMLNHIHKMQICDAAGRIRYAGSLSRANFGESQDPKGWWLWDIPARGAEPRVEFVEVPARRMLEFSAEFFEEVGWEENLDPDAAAGAEVKVVIIVPKDRQTEAAHMAARIRREFAHAHSLVVETRTNPVFRVRAAEIIAAKTEPEKLHAFWRATEMPDEDTQARLLAKLGALLEEVAV